MHGTFHAQPPLKASVEYTLFGDEDQIRNKLRALQEGQMSRTR
jgi:hypothetical protein